MANWSEYRLDVFASSETELNQIASRLQSPSRGVEDWAAEQLGVEGAEAIARVSDLCTVKAEGNLPPIDGGVQSSLRLMDSFKHFTGIVRSQLHETSKESPSALFLLADWDCQFHLPESDPCK
jgi:hypothetical protein